MSSGHVSPATTPVAWSRIDRLLLLCAFVTLLLFRLHAFGAPLESDECNYAYFAERLIAGDHLFDDLWDHQPPGIYLFLVPLTAALGSEPFVYRMAALLVTAATLWLLCATARKLAGREAGWAAAILFAIASSDPGIAGEGCNRELYMNFMTAFGVWWIVRGPHPAHVLCAGICLGLGSLIKTVVAAQWLALVPVIILVHLQRWPLSIALYAVGPTLTWLIATAWFAAGGRAEAFFDAVFTYNLGYSASEGSWFARLWAFNHAHIFMTGAAVWIAGACGLVWTLIRRPPAHGLLIALTLGSYLAVCLPGRFWPHYFLLLLPAAILLAATLVGQAAQLDRRLGYAALIIATGGLLATEIPYYAGVEPDALGSARYGPRMAWVRDQAYRINEVTAPENSIYVWSTDVGFYYYSQRRCATRFTMNEPLMASGPATLRRREQLRTDLEADPPRLILIIARPDHRHPCPELLQFIQDRRYVAAGRDAPHGLEILCDSKRPILPIDWTWPPEDPEVDLDE